MPKGLSLERRSSARFALNLEVSFTVAKRGVHGKSGSGRTLDLSSSGLSFITDVPLLTGEKLDVSLDWPVLLDGAIKLQLVMSGVVVRADATVVAMQIKRHEFRTRRFGLKAAPFEKSVG
jgi:hypothetical protein